MVFSRKDSQKSPFFGILLKKKVAYRANMEAALSKR